MQNRQSILLDSLLAMAAFDAEKNKHTDYLADRIFLLMLGQDNCHAMQILKSKLKEWELYQIRIRIEREIERNSDSAGKGISRKEFYLDLIKQISAVAGDGVIPNTAHFLKLLLSERESIAGRALLLYHITAEDIDKISATLPQEEGVSENTAGRKQAGQLRNSAPEDEEWEPQRETKQTKRRNANSTLAKFAVDLTAAASKGEIDNVIGRDREIGRLIQILGRRKKNNPILIGEAGVGKSAIVEGLALKIAGEDVPRSLLCKRLWSLDIASLIAGTKFRGEFEERMKNLMQELRADKNVILFIDEIHTIVGTGSSQGGLDTANMLKPALARGELQCIGATTLDEYRESVENDAALERRFQKIIVEPTSSEDTLEILRNIKPYYEMHHDVTYTDEALEACVALTERYVTERNFPDKAIDAMDEAGSKAHMQAVTDGREGKIAIGVSHIEEVITSMTGVPVERVSQDEKSRLSGMSHYLGEVVIGQEEAVCKVSRSILRSRAGLKDPRKPTGVFLFVGPTGVGKTLLAKELARWMFDGRDSLIRIDMSEFAEKHNVSRLIGSPPGYVGYGEGGQLTEAVRRQPYSVVLLDEIEKAHPDVFNVMLQMFDDGHLTDGLGRKVDFRNTIIIMTSNAGSRNVAQRGASVGYATSGKAGAESVNKESIYRHSLSSTFAPEFINRIDDIIIFNTLTESDIDRVVELELASLIERSGKLGYRLDISESAKREIAALGYEPKFGARSLKRIIMNRIEDPLAEMIVRGEILPGETVDIVHSGEAIELLVKTAS